MSIYKNKLLLFLLILSLISCKTLAYKKPAVKKPNSKFANQLLKNKKNANGQYYGQYNNSRGNFLPKDFDKVLRNFSANSGRAFKNFQIAIKKMSDNISKRISSFFENIKKFFKPKNRYAKKSDFEIWWDNFYNNLFKKKR